MSHTVTANQVMIFVVISFPIHISINGITRIEECITQLVTCTETVSKTSQTCDLQSIRITVIVEVIQCCTGCLQSADTGIHHDLLLIAESQRCKQTEPLITSQIKILSNTDVSSKFRKSILFGNIETGIEQRIFPGIIFKIRKRHFTKLTIQRGSFEKCTVMIHTIHLTSQSIELSSCIE